MSQGQCYPWGGPDIINIISKPRINELFDASPKTIDSIEGYIKTATRQNSICVYDVRAPDGYCIDYLIPFFNPLPLPFGSATLSIIDGKGVFGGTYRETFTEVIGKRLVLPLLIFWVWLLLLTTQSVPLAVLGLALVLV